MKKGVKIGIGVTAFIGLGTLVYFMFFKKDSKLYVLNKAE